MRLPCADITVRRSTFFFPDKRARPPVSSRTAPRSSLQPATQQND
jgi:hypothetical protein